MRQVIVFGFFLISSAFAELYECNGTWTNKPCDASQAKSIKEAGAGVEAIEVDKKLRWAEELKRMSERVHKESGVEVDVTEAVSECLIPSTSNSDCRAAINKKEAEIYSKERIALAEKKRAHGAAQVNQPSQTKVENNTTNVNVTDYNNTVAIGKNARANAGGSNPDSRYNNSNRDKRTVGVGLEGASQDELKQIKELQELEAQKNKSKSKIGFGAKH